MKAVLKLPSMSCSSLRRSVGSAAGLGLLATCESKSPSTDSATQTVANMTDTEMEVPLNPTTYADGWYAHNEITIMLTGAES